MLLSFQTAGVELVASHTVDTTHPVEASDGGGCADHDEAGGCDCGPNCHCCFTCAHHVTPALASNAVASPFDRLSVRTLEAPTPITAHVSSTDVAPPPKVPKLLA